MKSHHQGLAAEYLVAADLCKQGYLAHLAAAGSRYDVIVDVDGFLLRVQVKSTRQAKYVGHGAFPVYSFKLCSAHKKSISPEEVDLVALVALDTNQIAYLPADKCGGEAITIRPPGVKGSISLNRSYHIDQLPFSKVLEEIA